jgi:hypothetical protein
LKGKISLALFFRDPNDRSAMEASRSLPTTTTIPRITDATRLVVPE